MAKGVGFEGANLVFQAPESTTPEECSDLECFVGEGQIISCWRLSEEELDEVTRTGVVWLSVQGAGTPPTKISGFPLVNYNGRPAKAEPVMPRAPREAAGGDKEPPEPQSA